MRRFLQHVLPKGLHKVRYYGLWHPSRREQAARARLMLHLRQPSIAIQNEPHGDTGMDAAGQSTQQVPAEELRICPCCRIGHLVRAGRLYPKQARGP